MQVLVALLLFPTFVLARDGPDHKGRVPLMGWNTWCTQNKCGTDWCTSAEVLSVAEEIKSNGMLEHGYDHINLDDCWGVRDNITGEIMGDPTRFPETMPVFIKKIHNMGFKFGLYTDIGTEGCHHPFVGSWPDYQRDANTFAEWEVDYVKFDGCDKPAIHDAKTLTCNMSNALNRTGRDMWLNFHCWHDKACAECGNSFRVYSDHHDEWNEDGSSTLHVINYLANSRQEFWGANPSYGWPDADFIYTGGQGCAPKGQHSAPGLRCPGQTETEYVTEYSIWAIASGQIVLATDPRNMTSFMRATLMNDEVIRVFKDVSGFRSIAMVLDNSTTAQNAIMVDNVDEDMLDVDHQDHGTAPVKCSVSLTKQLSHSHCTLGTTFGCYDGNKTMFTSGGCRGIFSCDGVDGVECNIMGGGTANCPCVRAKSSNGQVWLRPLAEGGAAVVLFNNNDWVSTVTVNFSDVPDRQWDEHTSLSVRDLWAKSNNGTFVGRFSAKDIPPHGSAMITLSPIH